MVMKKNNEIEELKAQMTILIADKEQMDKRIQRKRDKNIQKKQRIQVLNDEILRLTDNITEWQEKMEQQLISNKNYNSFRPSQEKNQVSEDQYQSLQQQLQTQKVKIKEFQEYHQFLRRKISEKDTALDKLKTVLKKNFSEIKISNKRNYSANSYFVTMDTKNLEKGEGMQEVGLLELRADQQKFQIFWNNNLIKFNQQILESSIKSPLIRSRAESKAVKDLKRLLPVGKSADSISIYQENDQQIIYEKQNYELEEQKVNIQVKELNQQEKQEIQKTNQEKQELQQEKNQQMKETLAKIIEKQPLSEKKKLIKLQQVPKSKQKRQSQDATLVSQIKSLQKLYNTSQKQTFSTECQEITTTESATQNQKMVQLIIQLLGNQKFQDFLKLFTLDQNQNAKQLMPLNKSQSTINLLSQKRSTPSQFEKLSETIKSRRTLQNQSNANLLQEVKKKSGSLSKLSCFVYIFIYFCVKIIRHKCVLINLLYLIFLVRYNNMQDRGSLADLNQSTKSKLFQQIKQFSNTPDLLNIKQNQAQYYNQPSEHLRASNGNLPSVLHPWAYISREEQIKKQQLFPKEIDQCWLFGLLFCLEIQNDFDIFDIQCDQLDDPVVDNDEVIEEMYNHLQKLKENDLINYRKIRKLLSSTLKQVDPLQPSAYLALSVQNPLNNLHKTREIKKFEDSDPMTITYELFSTCYKKFSNQHYKQCGPLCIHLQRFYKKIGYSYQETKKHEITVNKLVYKELPSLQ